jgi:superfamily II DNA or RNA helicase
VIELRPYQEAAVAGLRQAFLDSYSSPLLVSATGSGKTVIFSYLASKLVANGKRVVIMAHREELLDQISETLLDFDVRHGRISAGMPYDRRLLAHVASVMTLVRRMDRVEVPDYVICDEAHHAIASSTWGAVIAGWRAANPKLRLIGVTATPQRLSGEGLGETFDTMILGPPVAELIEIGALSPYRLFGSQQPCDFDDVHMVGGDYNKRELREAIRDKPVIVGDAVSHYRKICDGVPAVAFCVSVEEAELTAEKFRSVGYRSASVDGKMEKGARRQLIADLRNGQCQVLTSCALVDEGLDVKGLVAILDLYPTMSLARAMQRWGRALRIAPGKDSAIIIDAVGNSSRHGLPDDPREWSLEGSRGPKKKETEVPVRKCVMYKLESNIVVNGRAYAPGAMVAGCSAVSSVAANKCRDCGFPFQVKARSVEVVDGELAEIDVARLKLESKRRQAQAGTLEELREVARERGYKLGWADHIFASRQKKRASS